MGTRADYYIGRGPDAIWLGSTAYDGYPDGIFAHQPGHISLKLISDDLSWSTAVETFLEGRDDSTLPERGWPWPWDDSATTDWAYAYDDGKVWASYFGTEWFEVDADDPRANKPVEDEDDPWDEEAHQASKTAVFPNMKDRKNVRYDKGSGAIFIGMG